jgi:hypothetical protein
MSAPAGLIGDTINIYGSNFSTTPSNNTVEFNGIPAKVISSTNNTIVAVIPAGTTTGNVSVSVNGQPVGNTSAQSFTVLTHNFYMVGANGLPQSSTYFKNGAFVATIPGAYVTGIFASGKDVYLCGTTKNSSNQDIAAYWKNEIVTALTDGTKPASAMDICISGSDIYVAGGDGSGMQYWKNGNLVSLPITGTFKSGGTNLVFASGNDVYVAGTYSDVNNNQLSAYWKNGVQTNLPGSFPYLYSMFVSGSDVYIAGHTFSNKNTAAVWKNGVRSDYPDGGTAAGVYVNGTDVYVSGYTSGDGGNDAPYYWKNGIKISLSPGPGTTYGIVGDGNDIYLGGGVEGATVPVYGFWYNGQFLLLPDRAVSIDNGITDIFLQTE